MRLAWPFLVGYVLDLLLGDPPGWPHPIRWLGRSITFWETRLYRPRILAGIIFCLAVLGTSLTVGMAAVAAAGHLAPGLQALVAAYLVYAGLATRSLHQETWKVEEALARGELEEAREHLALIVSRETTHLNEVEIRRATLETLGENLSDGVIAPLFYLLLAGLPGLIFYKTANTLDSMVGYKNERYERFGKAAARLDDVLNFLPARLTAVLMALLAGPVGLNGREAWRLLRRDGGRALSPNAGRPMATLAGALGVQLGGPTVYFGRRVEKPFLGDPGPPPEGAHYRQAVVLLYAVSSLMAGATFLAFLITGAGLGGLGGFLVGRL